MNKFEVTCVALLAALMLMACPVLQAPTPTPEPTATWTPEPTPTPVVVVVTATPEPTPRFVAVPSVDMLTDELAKEIGLGFIYWEFHFVPADTEVRIIYGWPGTDVVYRAVYKFVEGEWKLVERKAVEMPTPTPSPAPTPGAGREARAW